MGIFSLVVFFFFWNYGMVKDENGGCMWWRQMRLEHMHRRDAYTGRQKVQSDNPIGVIHGVVFSF